MKKGQKILPKPPTPFEKFMVRLRAEEKTCIVCFGLMPNYKYKFCSPECSNKYHATIRASRKTTRKKSK